MSIPFESGLYPKFKQAASLLNNVCYRTAGAGGGWRMFQGHVPDEQRLLMGQPLVAGAVGGKACYNSTDGRGDGGFGGGGGGCTAGGGGGGYSGL